MIAEVTIDIDDAFNSLNYMEQAECVSNFYDWLNSNQQEQFMNWLRENPLLWWLDEMHYQ